MPFRHNDAYYKRWLLASNPRKNDITCKLIYHECHDSSARNTDEVNNLTNIGVIDSTGYGLSWLSRWQVAVSRALSVFCPSWHLMTVPSYDRTWSREVPLLCDIMIEKKIPFCRSSWRWRLLFSRSDNWNADERGKAFWTFTRSRFHKRDLIHPDAADIRVLLTPDLTTLTVLFRLCPETAWWWRSWETSSRLAFTSTSRMTWE